MPAHRIKRFILPLREFFPALSIGLHGRTIRWWPGCEPGLCEARSAPGRATASLRRPATGFPTTTSGATPSSWRSCSGSNWPTSSIEVFFKQVKQTLKPGSFLGHSANAVRWQAYSALLVHVLLRYMAHLARWAHSITRLFAVARSALRERLDLLGLLKSYGTASGRFKVLGALNEAWLPGFAPAST